MRQQTNDPDVGLSSGKGNVQSPLESNMGIPGILKEIGKGERIALAKLAVEHFEKSKRPYRIAIDAAIWNFQNQAGQGGKNPALRTLFYRLLKLLALPIQPVFVYDGKNKPLTKRGKTVSRYGTCISNETSKKLIQTFRFPHHTAPGEAEAECAMLQRKGLVDAVMSQDVDAIMFGSTVTLRDWSKEASKHNKSPTHVSLLDDVRIKSMSGLDPDGMILVALLSGGDYDEAGVPGFGASLACEAARAGFGADLLELVRANDNAGIAEWRERLQYELETNESGYFRTKHRLVKVPDSFPDRRILSYYIDPAVTPEQQLSTLESTWQKMWAERLDVKTLRDYVADTFEWNYKPGAWKFVRVFAPAFLADGLRRGSSPHISSVEQITERRKHFVSDGIPELRVTVVPADVVGLDLEAEEDSPEYLAQLAAADEVDEAGNANEDAEDLLSMSGPKQKRKSPPWLPWNEEKMWIAETVVGVGAKDHVEAWHQRQREIEADPKKFATRNCRKPKDQPKRKDASGMKAGALLNYVEISEVSTEELRVITVASPPQSPVKLKGQVQHTSRTPSKSRIPRATNAPSPKVQDYFKATKIQSPSKLLEENADPFENLSQSLEDTLKLDNLDDSLATGKHSRPSTSTSNSSEPVQRTVKKCVKTRRRIGERDRATYVEAQVCSHDAGGKARTIAVMASSTSSPSRVRRPLESFFAPYIALNEKRQQRAPALEQRRIEAECEVVPLESSTGLTTTLRSSHIQAIPRSSLPGTWKEADNMLDMSSQDLSVIDLTSD